MKRVFTFLFVFMTVLVFAVQTQAAQWGSLRDNGCDAQRPGKRQFSAVLWNIPWGQPWIGTCQQTPGPEGAPIFSSLPRHCEEGWGNVWGNWSVPDSSCGCDCQGAHWGGFSFGCCGPGGQGTGTYSAILWDIPWGQSWECCCRQIPGSPAGITPRTPDRCITGINMWGEWDVPDPLCCCQETLNCQCWYAPPGQKQPKMCEVLCPDGGRSWAPSGWCN